VGELPTALEMAAHRRVPGCDILVQIAWPRPPRTVLAVDRLEDGDSPALAEYAVQLLEGRVLVPDVDEH
jgi:hypothetical protein